MYWQNYITLYLYEVNFTVYKIDIRWFSLENFLKTQIKKNNHFDVLDDWSKIIFIFNNVDPVSVDLQLQYIHSSMDYRQFTIRWNEDVIIVQFRE